MIMLDNTVVNVSLPAMQASLGLELSELEWIVTGYALSFGAFMLTGGKLADLFGRRRLFVTGIAVFSAASLGCGLAASPLVLIGARVAQGVGAALMNPATLSIIMVAFEPRERGRAIGIWVGASAVALAVGPLVGGLITEVVGWSWIFFINVPIGVLAIAAAYRFIDESRDTSQEQRADIPGLLTSGLGLFALTYALIEANGYGWASPRILGAFAIAVSALAAFTLLEQRQRLPMLDLSLFRNPAFAGANLVILLAALAMFGVFFYVSLYMQQVLGLSAVEAGAMFLPMTVLIILVAPRAGVLADRFGSRVLVGVGQLLVAIAAATRWDLLTPLVMSGIGMAMTMTPATAAGMAALNTDKAGVGSAVLNSARQIGGSIGIALTGTVVTARIADSLAGGSPAGVAFVEGIRGGFLFASAVAGAGAVVGFATLRRPDTGATNGRMKAPS
jgi:EmrB/QacA subfamily drug resistance transporter